MIGAIATWLIARNPAMTLTHARRLAIGGILLAGLLITGGGFALWLHLHDEGVRRVENLERDNRDLTNNAEANEKAGLSKGKRDRAETQEQEELEDAVDEAEADGRSAADDAWSGNLFDS